MKLILFKGMKMIFLFLIISNSQPAYPFEEVKTIDIRTLSLGQMRALSQGLVNPAYLPFTERKQIGASVFNRFEMKELSTKSVFILFPNRLLDMNFHLSAFGYDEYQLTNVQAGFAKKLSSGFSIGISGNYLTNSSILEEQNQTYLQADLGFFWQINEDFQWALLTENLIHTRNLQPRFCFSGVNYQLIPTVCILLETGFDFQNQFSVSAGLEYGIAEQITIRGGFRNNLQTPSFGFAYELEHWKIDAAFLFHQKLGLSNGISVAYLF
jgi:hypothetical protein